MKVAEAILKAKEIAEKTSIGKIGGVCDHNIILKISELLLKYEK